MLNNTTFMYQIFEKFEMESLIGWCFRIIN